tara:strand:+ start:375 stop:911 length:537 start_codon:yes stop_codon:yes gene_type:complete
MLEIRELLLKLEDEYEYTRTQIMEIAKIKDKDTITRWFKKGRADAKAHARLWIHLQSLEPVEFSCPYGIPLENMFVHAMNLQEISMRERYPEIATSTGWHYSWMKEKYPEIDETEYKRYCQIKHHRARLLKHKHYYDIGWTDKKSFRNAHYGISDEIKIWTVANYHDDKRLRNHFNSN